jgi:hypothetical protein
LMKTLMSASFSQDSMIHCSRVCSTKRLNKGVWSGVWNVERQDLRYQFWLVATLLVGSTVWIWFLLSNEKDVQM